MRRQKIFSWVIFAFFCVFLLIYLFPLFLVVLNSFKSYGEIMTNVLSFPENVSLDNLSKAFDMMQYPSAFLNTFIITFVGVCGIILLASTAGYKIARTQKRYASVMFFFLISPMMIPFQSFMIALVKVTKTLGMIGSVWGLSIVYWGLGVPMALFLYQGFVKGIPVQLDESASLDGCNQLQIFVYIIFPILKPVNATVIIINAMWIWNDFLLPLLLLGSNKSARTLQLSAYSFIGQYKMEWQNIMSGVILTVTPAVIIYLILQKHIIKGMVTGAVKG